MTLQKKGSKAAFLKCGHRAKKKRGYSLIWPIAAFLRPRFLKQSKTCDYRIDRSMAALFKRGPRPGPIPLFKTWPKVSTIAAFKMWPKTYTLGCVLNATLSFGLGPHFKHGLRYRS